VDDIEAEHARLAGLGFDPTAVKQLYRDGKLAVGFFFVQDPDGYKVDVIQRQGRYV
jgi:lactoylglutathione lyase